GIVVITAFITPQRSQRASARGIIGAEDFLEIYVTASFEECARRDPKGLYAKAATGQVKQFTGRDSTFEPPAAGEAALVLDTEAEAPERSLEKLYTVVAPQIHPP
ncbi:MAG: adenylyl-sulfate kinase, partial [Verrucomicrobiota bacterium]|nr:adenylyl-sulfate kinase [Verrucomicrobiota bacterium]